MYLPKAAGCRILCYLCSCCITVLCIGFNTYFSSTRRNLIKKNNYGELFFFLRPFCRCICDEQMIKSCQPSATLKSLVSDKCNSAFSVGINGVVPWSISIGRRTKTHFCTLTWAHTYRVAYSQKFTFEHTILKAANISANFPSWKVSIRNSRKQSLADAAVPTADLMSKAHQEMARSSSRSQISNVPGAKSLTGLVLRPCIHGHRLAQWSRSPEICGV